MSKIIIWVNVYDLKWKKNEKGSIDFFISDPYWIRDIVDENVMSQ